jgi:hypothetical protein
MRFIRPVAYTFLILMWMFIIGGTVIAGSTINSTSGNNTAIEGGYTGGATTYESGSSSSTTSTSNSTSNIRSAPPTASAPGMNTSNNCAMSLSGGVQTFSIGVSGGKSYIDKNCELIVLSRTLQSFGMKVAAISLLCQDERVFQAMFMAKTYCPVEGKISQEAYDLIVNKYNYEMPTYKKYVELEKKKIIKPKKKPKELHTR